MLRSLLTHTPGILRPALVRAMNLYPPFVGAGIRVTRVAADLSHFDVEMRSSVLNRGSVGAHFGGSLYAMCDPFFLLALTAQLGPEYLIWDKTAQIEFRRQARGTVRAHFAVSPAEVADIRVLVAHVGKCEPAFHTDVLGPDGEVVATVHKYLWVKKRAALASSARTEAHHAHTTA